MPRLTYDHDHVIVQAAGVVLRMPLDRFERYRQDGKRWMRQERMRRDEEKRQQERERRDAAKLSWITDEKG